MHVFTRHNFTSCPPLPTPLSLFTPHHTRALRPQNTPFYPPQALPHPTPPPILSINNHTHTKLHLKQIIIPKKSIPSTGPLHPQRLLRQIHTHTHTQTIINHMIFHTYLQSHQNSPPLHTHTTPGPVRPPRLLRRARGAPLGAAQRRAQGRLQRGPRRPQPDVRARSGGGDGRGQQGA